MARVDPEDGANPEVDGGSVGDGGTPTVDGAAVDSEASKPFAKLGIEDAKIRAKVNLADNLAEIRLFTGDEPDDVACTP